MADSLNEDEERHSGDEGTILYEIQGQSWMVRNLPRSPPGTPTLLGHRHDHFLAGQKDALDVHASYVRTR